MSVKQEAKTAPELKQDLGDKQIIYVFEAFDMPGGIAIGDLWDTIEWVRDSSRGFADGKVGRYWVLDCKFRMPNTGVLMIPGRHEDDEMASYEYKLPKLSIDKFVPDMSSEKQLSGDVVKKWAALPKKILIASWRQPGFELNLWGVKHPVETATHVNEQGDIYVYAPAMLEVIGKSAKSADEQKLSDQAKQSQAEESTQTVDTS